MQQYSVNSNMLRENTLHGNNFLFAAHMDRHENASFTAAAINVTSVSVVSSPHFRYENGSLRKIFPKRDGNPPPRWD